ncbi:MAG: hypothetical protein U9R25_16685 [Chloroflexota bacterium]|nr:hypothetical protein [Chloroflexota bacterium]
MAITYYLANRESIDRYIQRRQSRDEQAYQKWAAQPTPRIERLRAIREQQARYE